MKVISKCLLTHDPDHPSFDVFEKASKEVRLQLISVSIQKSLWEANVIKISNIHNESSKKNESLDIKMKCRVTFILLVICCS